MKLRLGLPGGEASEAAGLDSAGARRAEPLRPAGRAAGRARPPDAAVSRRARAVPGGLGARRGAALRDAWASPPGVDRAGAAPGALLRARGAAARRAAARRRPPGRGCCPRARSASCCCDRCSSPGAESAAEGWGGDGWRLYDAGSRTLLLWRSEWDTPADAREFRDRAARPLRPPRDARAGPRGVRAVPQPRRLPVRDAGRTATPSSSSPATIRCAVVRVLGGAPERRRPGGPAPALRLTAPGARTLE